MTLAEAREIATEWRRKLKKGIDPLDEKKATKEAEAARRTFGECADELSNPNGARRFMAANGA